MYDLTVDGQAAFYQRRPTAKRLIRREPLVGAVNGANTIFLTPHRPFLYDSLVVYTADSPFDGVTLYSADQSGGVVRLAAAPTSQPVADYTAVPLEWLQVNAIAWSGFDLMQALWARNYRLSSDPSTYSPADPDAAHIYIVDVNDDNTVFDPPAGGLTFSTSYVQKGFLARCIEVAFLDIAMTDAALADVVIRERLGGIAIDPSRRTKNLVDARAEQWNELLRALQLAQEEALGDEAYVASVKPIHTEEYVQVWQWQKGHASVGSRAR